MSRLNTGDRTRWSRTAGSVRFDHEDGRSVRVDLLVLDPLVRYLLSLRRELGRDFETLLHSLDDLDRECPEGSSEGSVRAALERLGTFGGRVEVRP